MTPAPDEITVRGHTTQNLNVDPVVLGAPAERVARALRYVAHAIVYAATAVAIAIVAAAYMIVLAYG